MKNTVVLERYKKEFEQLYNLINEEETKEQIKESISEINSLLEKKELSEEMVTLYCNFYGQLIGILLLKVETAS